MLGRVTKSWSTDWGVAGWGACCTRVLGWARQDLEGEGEEGKEAVREAQKCPEEAATGRKGRGGRREATGPEDSAGEQSVSFNAPGEAAVGSTVLRDLPLEWLECPWGWQKAP